MKNPQVAQVFREISAFLEMEGVPFKPRAYEKAAESIAALEDPVEEIFTRGGVKALEKIPGIGKSFAAKIAEFLSTGQVADHEKLRAATPVDLDQLLGIEGLGPKGIKSLYEHLGVRTLTDLEAAARAGKIRQVPGFGERSEQKILQGIGFLEARTGRLPIGTVLPLAREIEKRLREIPGVAQVAIAGSIRRRQESIGDIDFLVVASDPALVMERFVSMPEVVV